MKHLVTSFREHLGHRGVHFYNESGDCNFLPWGEVLRFLDSFQTPEGDEFAEKLLTTLSNYDPDIEFLAVCQDGDLVSVELYSENRKFKDRV